MPAATTAAQADGSRTSPPASSVPPEKRIGAEEMWDRAEAALDGALRKAGLDFELNPGDGAFYGPKLDFHIEDSLGRTWQCGTIQLDYQLPGRFDLAYTGADGQKHTPVMIHRVVFGSIERFIGVITEHFAGAFPLWLSPVQVRVLTVGTAQNDYAEKVNAALTAAGLRSEADTRFEKIGFKIREAQMMKVPYMLILGDKEAENGVVAVRSRKEGDLGTMTPEELIEKLHEEIRSKEI